ncbi:hypothetical protein [Pseudomonas syringae]|uniref:hypothetical protein n=1 Tax=Pseudomonas syringae TaxID=317 RepID=UPI000EFF40A2|nr:hypothetical protein [Pseudomonas syringae]
MSVSANEFFDQSQRLIDSANEIDLRCAVSRGYYSAYHVALITAASLSLDEFKSSGVGAHEQLIRKFESKGPGLKNIARRLRDKKRVRCVADYQLEEKVTKEEAQLFIVEVGILIADLERLGRIAAAEVN